MKAGSDDTAASMILVLQTSLSSDSSSITSSSRDLSSQATSSDDDDKKKIQQSEQSERQQMHVAWQQVVTSTPIHCNMILFPDPPPPAPPSSSLSTQQQQQQQEQEDAVATATEATDNSNNNNISPESRSRHHSIDYPILRFRNERLHPIGVDNLLVLSNSNNNMPVRSAMHYILSLTDCTMTTSMENLLLALVDPLVDSWSTSSSNHNLTKTTTNGQVVEDSVVLPIYPVSSTHRVSFLPEQPHHHHQQEQQQVEQDPSIVHLKVDFRFSEVAYEIFAEAFSTVVAATAPPMQEKMSETPVVEDDACLEGSQKKTFPALLYNYPATSDSSNDEFQQEEPSSHSRSEALQPNDDDKSSSPSTTPRPVQDEKRHTHHQSQHSPLPSSSTATTHDSSPPFSTQQPQNNQDLAPPSLLLHKLEGMVESELQGMHRILAVMMGMAMVLLVLVVWILVQMTTTRKNSNRDRRQRLQLARQGGETHHQESQRRRHRHSHFRSSNSSGSSVRSGRSKVSVVVSPPTVVTVPSMAYRRRQGCNDADNHGRHTPSRHLVSPLSMDRVLCEVSDDHDTGYLARDHGGARGGIIDPNTTSKVDNKVAITSSHHETLEASNNPDDDDKDENNKAPVVPSLQAERIMPSSSGRPEPRRPAETLSVPKLEQNEEAVRQEEDTAVAATKKDLSPCSKLALEWTRSKNVRRRHRNTDRSSKIVLDPLSLPFHPQDSTTPAPTPTRAHTTTTFTPQRPVFGVRTSQVNNNNNIIGPPGKPQLQKQHAQGSKRVKMVAANNGSNGIGPTMLTKPMDEITSMAAAPSVTGTSVSTPAAASRRSFAQDYWM